MEAPHGYIGVLFRVFFVVRMLYYFGDLERDPHSENYPHKAHMFRCVSGLGDPSTCSLG